MTSSISYKHVTFWYLFLKPHHTTYCSEIGVPIRKVTEEGLFTLPVDRANSIFQLVI